CSKSVTFIGARMRYCRFSSSPEPPDQPSRGEGQSTGRLLRRLAVTVILLSPSVGLACWSAQSTSASNSPAQQAAQEAPPPAVGDPQRLRDEIKIVEDLLARPSSAQGLQVQTLKRGLVDRGAALYLLAHHYARLGDTAKTLALLKECVALDEGFDP